MLLGALALVLAPGLAHVWPGASRGFTDDSFPGRAMAVADSLHPGPRVLNSYGWGGYISWVYQGRWKVFVDGRAGFFAGDVLTDYFRILELGPGWQEALRRRQPDWMLLERKSPLVVAAPLTGHWRVAYSDSLAAILTPVPPPGPAR